jgi:hypothetical protein
MGQRCLGGDIKQYIENHGLSKKWEKAKRLFESDPSYPSLNTSYWNLSIA